MKEGIRNFVVLMTLAIFVMFALVLYDHTNDPSAHNCTQECAIEGCPFEEE